MVLVFLVLDWGELEYFDVDYGFGVRYDLGISEIMMDG